MRRLLASLLLVLLIATAAQAKPIHKLKVIVRTGEEWGAGTKDTVYFSLGPSYEWTLMSNDLDPFHSGKSTTFMLPPQGLNTEDVKYVKIRKGRDSESGRWFLHAIEVWVNGLPFYRNETIDTWIEGNHLDWIAPNFPKNK